MLESRIANPDVELERDLVRGPQEFFFVENSRFLRLMREPWKYCEQREIRAFFANLKALVTTSQDLSIVLNEMYRVLSRPDVSDNNPWSRTLALLSLQAIRSAQARRPIQTDGGPVERKPPAAAHNTYEDIVKKFNLPIGTDNRRTLQIALVHLYQECSKPDHWSGPQAFYWIARIVKDLDPRSENEAVLASWRLSHDDPPDDELPDKLPKILSDYFRALDEALKQHNIEPADHGEDPVISHLINKVRAKHLPQPVAERLPLTWYGRVAEFFNGSPKFPWNSLGIVRMVMVVVSIIVVIYSVIVWQRSASEINQFRQHETSLRNSLGLEGTEQVKEGQTNNE